MDEQATNTNTAELPEDCPVCMEPMWVLLPGPQAATMQLSPLFACETCHKHVHWRCIDEAVCTSLKAQCPMCRAPFQHPVVQDSPASAGIADLMQYIMQQVDDAVGRAMMESVFPAERPPPRVFSAE